MNTGTWRVYTIVDGKETLVYRDRWMPTVDDMDVVSKVRGKKYKVLNPQGKDVTECFAYGTPT